MVRVVPTKKTSTRSSRQPPVAHPSHTQDTARQGNPTNPSCTHTQQGQAYHSSAVASGTKADSTLLLRAKSSTLLAATPPLLIMRSRRARSLLK